MARRILAAAVFAALSGAAFAQNAEGLAQQLPGGGAARICAKADTYPDGRARVGRGIEPTARVAPTVADLRRGRNTAPNAALAAPKAEPK